WLEERGRRGHLHIVLRGVIECPVAADANLDAGRLDQGLHARLDSAWWRRRRDRRNLVRQAIALVGIEDGEALQERNGAGFPAAFRRALLRVVRHKAVGVDDRGAALALADMTAERQGLAEREPALAGEAMLDDSAPQDEHVDAGVRTAGRCVLRHRELRLRGR